MAALGGLCGHVSLGKASPCMRPLLMARRESAGLELPEPCSTPAGSRGRAGWAQGWARCTSASLLPAPEEAQPPGPMAVSCRAPQFYWCCSSTLTPPQRAGSAVVGLCPSLTHSLEARRGMALVASMPLPAGPGCDIWLVLRGHQDCGALSLQLILLGRKLHLLKST